MQKSKSDYKYSVSLLLRPTHIYTEEASQSVED